ncbi:MAG: DUF1161 domain-containing protein [Candidatus Electrothrix sp. GM3_4]|nr:DUF1161 domain-containing protein [Candidatus Electrothrix sp. GM3_4]
MRYLIIFFVIFFSLGHAYAAITPCEKLKAEIAAKIDAAGVKSYTLLVEKNDKADEGIRENRGKVVGSCEGGTKKITYIKKQINPSRH